MPFAGLVYVEKSSDSIRKAVNEEPFAVSGEIHEVEPGPSFDLQVPDWLTICAPHVNRAFFPFPGRRDIFAVPGEIPVVEAVWFNLDGDAGQLLAPAFDRVECVEDEFAPIGTLLRECAEVCTNPGATDAVVKSPR